jgi:hypothetical protein
MPMKIITAMATRKRIVVFIEALFGNSAEVEIVNQFERRYQQKQDTDGGDRKGNAFVGVPLRNSDCDGHTPLG